MLCAATSTKCSVAPLNGMEETEQDVAEVNVKVKITLKEDSAPDYTVAGGRQTRSITKPKFDHTVSAVIQKKEKKTGTLSGNYELVWDREICKYVMRPIDDGQMDLFDKDDDHEAEDEIAGLPAGKAELPPPSDVIDADYKVVEDEEREDATAETERERGGPGCLQLATPVCWPEYEGHGGHGQLHRSDHGKQGSPFLCGIA